jgi:hypothetical protein
MLRKTSAGRLATANYFLRTAARLLPKRAALADLPVPLVDRTDTTNFVMVAFSRRDKW